MGQREFKTEDAWSEWLHEFGLKPMAKSRWYRLTTGIGSRRGLPDFLGSVNGFFVALELKLDDAKPDPTREKLQQYECKKILETGAPIAADRCTPSTWPEIQRKLLFLASIPREDLQKDFGN